MKVIAIIVVIGVLVSVGFLFFVYLGVYNVSALLPHTSVVHWIMSATMDNSVRRHAEQIQAPDLTDPARVARGAGYYRDSCAPCHGAPGVERLNLAKGLYPPPPDLGVSVSDWTPSELYWIVENGVKMTGMPAFKPSYDNNQIWDLVVFLQRLPGLSAQQYQILIAAAGAELR